MRKFLLILGFSAWFGATATQAADLQSARSLADSGNASAALAELLELQATHAGEADFDMLLANTAIAAGRPDVALFALERVVAVDPTRISAYGMLANAYDLLGDAASAEAAITTAQSIRGAADSLPDDFEPLVSRLNRGILGKHTKWSGYLGVTLGYDTNANSTNTDRAAFARDSDLVGDESFFGVLEGGGSVVHPLTGALDLTGRLDALQRVDEGVQKLDVGAVSARLGLLYRHGKSTFQTSLLANRVNVDWNLHQRGYGVRGSWEYEIRPTDRIEAFVQYRDLDFSGAAFRDGDRITLGGRYTHDFGGEYFPRVTATLYRTEHNQDSGANPEQGFTLYGVNVSGSFIPATDWRVFGSLGFSNQDHDGRDQTFNRTRNDDRVRLSFGARYTYEDVWVITPRITHTNNDSNIVLQNFDRTILSLSVHRVFN